MKLKNIMIVCAIAFVCATVSIIFLLKAADGPSLGGDFKLNHKDKTWIFSENTHPLSLLYVGYAKCPDVCPFSLNAAAEAFKELSADDLKKIQLIFISVDYTHDTAEAVDKYAKAFHPQFTGLTGTESEINKAISLFGASYMYETTDSYLGYTISHTDRIFFLNKKGIVIDSLSHPRNPKEITQIIKEHL